ncbi:hypothetical protein KRX52_11425 [Pseudomonas sp. MAP12]|uniref:Uncharacterized protein n=1 Tax=Geopseudomonas aromaticivorans TaxID=2849492 RepID=A0ABS6MX66_9GAMM|nr:hypothetical protein [Pseudomonas aromaticivorans]MBV2133400.1 hypothetical protein [Pseudomonas aromaticivorans]
MTDHDYRYDLLNPQYTPTGYSTLTPGPYQDIGNNCSIQAGDSLPIALKGNHDLSMRLAMAKVRHLIDQPDRWLAMVCGSELHELNIHTWPLSCDGCCMQFDLEFAGDGALSELALAPDAGARLADQGWHHCAGRHRSPWGPAVAA